VEATTGDVHVGLPGDNSDGWGEFYNYGTIKAGNDVVFSIRAQGSFVNRGTIEAGRDVVLGEDPRAVFRDWEAYLDTGTRQGAGFDVLPAARGLPGARLDYVGQWYPSKDLIHFYPYAALDNGNGGRIAAGRDMDLHYARNSGGSIEAANDVRIWSVAKEAFAGADAAPGVLAAGRDLWLYGLPRYCRNILLCGFSRPPIALSTDRLNAGRDVRIALTGQADNSNEDFTNSFQIVATRNLRVDADAGFTNQGSLTAGGALGIHANRITNTAGVETRSRVYADQRYPGCRTDHGGSCSAEEETWRLPALLSAGGDLTLAAAKVDNLGATILAGNDLTVATADFTNDRRELAAAWRAEYFVQDPPRWQADTIGGSGGGATESGGAGQSGATYTRHTASGRTTIGEVPSLIQAGGRFSVAGRPQRDSPGTAPAAGGGSGSGAPPAAPAAERFANTQSIIAGAVSISAGEIRNGIGFADVDRRAQPPRLAPASIDLSQLSGPAFAAPAGAADVSGAALAALLPAAQRSSLPFALSPAQEEAALRSALLQSTGRALLVPAPGAADGLSPESRQRAWLAANAAAFALESGAVLGEPLTEAQRNALFAPLLWYVAREGNLVPVLYLPEAWRAAAARVDGGLIEGALGIALSARTIDNTGFVISDGVLDVRAVELFNRKRNATLPETRIPIEGGTLRIRGDTVQPGGFMRAAAWQLAVERVLSRSGEFVVSGTDAADTAARSAAFEQALREELNEAFVFEQAQARDRSPQKRSFSTQRRKTLCAHSFASFAPLRCAFSGIKMHPHHHILRVDDALSHPHAWRLVPPRGWPKWRVH
jgi:filamentous hemagglutinin